MPTTSSPCTAYRFCHWAKTGISTWHGAQHVTRKLTTREGGTNRTIAKNTPKIENARDRSPWRLNLDGLVVQPVLRPPAPPAANLQLSLPLLPLAAPVSSLRLSSNALPPARPGANPPARIGVFSPGSTGGKHPIFIVYYALPIDRRLTFQLSLASLLRQGRRPTADSHRILILQLGWLNNLRLSPIVVAASSLRLLLPQPPAFTSCCPHSRHTGGELPTRIGCSTLRLHRFRFTRLPPGVSTSGWAFDAPLASTEPRIAG